MMAASDRTGSCTTAAELKSNVARCLCSPRVRPLVQLYTVSISLRLFGRYFLFPATRTVAGRSPANLITIFLCMSKIALVTFSLRFVLFYISIAEQTDVYFRNEHIDLTDSFTNIRSAKCRRKAFHCTGIQRIPSSYVTNSNYYYYFIISVSVFFFCIFLAC